MALCKFYQQGNCKFGSACRFEHPGAANNRGQPQNRFGVLTSAGGGGSGSGGLQDALGRYNITTETIEKDLTNEAPQWILSAYAPGRNAPEQLFGGFPREQSFEEMRMHYLTAKASGNEQRALNEAQEIYQNAQQQMQTAVRNVQDAARFIVEAENKHPNRIDVCRDGTHGAPFGEFLVGKRPVSIAQPEQQANPFNTAISTTTTSSFGGTATQPTPSAFGQPTALGQRPNPFGTPAFGQPAQPSSGFSQPSQTPSAFGQTSAQPQASAFGQPSQLGGSAFGQTAPTTSAFGQASALGAKPNPFGAPAFGQPAQPANSAASSGSAFGQVGQMGGVKPNPFAAGAGTGAGATGNNSSPFGAINNNNVSAPAANPFASSNSTPNNPTAHPFASNPLNQSNNTSQPSPFGQPGEAAKPNPFAAANTSKPQQSSNPFAQNSQNQTNDSFGANKTPNPFGQAAPQQQNPFASGGQPQQTAPPTSAPAGGGNPYAPGSAKQHPALESYANKNMNGTLASFKGKPVTYKGNLPGIRAFDGTWTRIWFPGGPPAYYKDTELLPDQYDEKSRNQWATFAQTGAFADGMMPELPPPRECTLWDF
ncbi:hypothetical protein QQS21_006737 [Conoideocrella luteorostrata]|uniref:C3H1-type domain-containing protein n=1 Tax=Conoideocrella luteorostrata TaxID=1105319 RepID=A0AAJ0CPF3_9HYPO|nr:hypothetical protein QQS21_006737 [Conoideocrella luteorostrata]